MEFYPRSQTCSDSAEWEQGSNWADFLSFVLPKSKSLLGTQLGSSLPARAEDVCCLSGFRTAEDEPRLFQFDVQMSVKYHAEFRLLCARWNVLRFL
jgi:hypothetical protein